MNKLQKILNEKNEMMIVIGNKETFEKDIKTILTHEQYESNSYKVVE